MVDTHCHLTDPRLLQQIDAVLARAAAAGVNRMITVGTSIADARATIDLCTRHPQLRCAVGLHPNYCQDAQPDDVAVLRDLQVSPTVVALGEMGLDYHYDFCPRDRQRRFFQAQLALAAELRRKVVLHCRDAVSDTLAILQDYPVTGVFHCFTGTPSDAEAILAAGHWISYTGVITFRKNQALRDCIRMTPRDRLMVETDAPYLAPEPFRSRKVNEPALVVHTAAVVARQWGATPEEVDQITTANAARFFGRW
ncbi:MAG: TatD family hydrolase [Phycisphaerae bacterium]|nr:TatD family hydrolase [Phycisphaerae bacterium]